MESNAKENDFIAYPIKSPPNIWQFLIIVLSLPSDLVTIDYETGRRTIYQLAYRLWFQAHLWYSSQQGLAHQLLERFV